MTPHQWFKRADFATLIPHHWIPTAMMQQQGVSINDCTATAPHKCSVGNDFTPTIPHQGIHSRSRNNFLSRTLVRGIALWPLQYTLQGVTRWSIQGIVAHIFDKHELDAEEDEDLYEVIWFDKDQNDRRDWKTNAKEEVRSRSRSPVGGAGSSSASDGGRTVLREYTIDELLREVRRRTR